MNAYQPQSHPAYRVPITPQHPAYQHPVQQWGPVAPQVAPQAPVYTYAKRRQSVKTHLWLLLFTGGVGNVGYVLWANSKAAARVEW